MTIILVYLAAVMLTALGILIAYRKCILRSKAIPKIWGVPILGILMHLKSYDYQKILTNVLRNKGKICAVQLGSYECLWLNDHKVIREAWSNPACCGRPKMQGIVDRTAGFLGGIIFNEGQDFKEQRSFTVSHLKDLGLGKQCMEGVISSEVDTVIETLVQTKGQPLSTRHLFNVASLNVLWGIISGDRYRHDDPALNNLVESITRNMELQGGAMVGFFIPWLAHWFPNLVGWTSYLSDANKVFKFWRQFAKRRIKSFEMADKGHGPTCFVDMYIQHVKQCKSLTSSFFGDKGELSLASTLQDLFIAGTETTSATLSWLMLHLAVFQNYQENIYQEICHVVGDRKPSLGDRRKMLLTEAFISETMRHVTLAPLGMVHCTTDDVDLCGTYFIPKGTILHANICAAHHDPSQWERPHHFFPERFISSDGSKHLQHDSFLPFSFGKRRCPGELLARHELFLFLVGIIHQFSVTIDPSEIEDCLKPKLGVSATPKPHLLEFHQRQ